MGYVRYEDREARDAEIRRLAEAGMSGPRIAQVVGCHRVTVWEVLAPGAKARHNARRAAYNTSPEGLQRQRDYRARKAAS